MRVFRIKQRVIRTKKVIKHREYVGIDKLRKFGLDVYNRYLSDYYGSVPELYEYINDKWVRLDNQTVKELFNN